MNLRRVILVTLLAWAAASMYGCNSNPPKPSTPGDRAATPVQCEAILKAGGRC